MGNADNTADDIGYGQPLIYYKKDDTEFYGNGKMPMWFRLQDSEFGRPDGAGDNLNLWKLPYGGSVTIDVNKWHRVSISSIKEDGIVRRSA